MSINTSMDRRGFIAGSLAAGAAAAFGLAGCAAPTSSDKKDASGEEKTSQSNNADWLGEAPAINESDIVETIDTEVLVVGAGCSGLVAANFSAAEGAKTLLIEKYDMGTGLRGSGIGAVGSRKQKEAGVDIDPLEICNDLVHYSLNNSNMDLHRLWADHSGEAVDWYCDLVDGVDLCRIDLEWNMPAEKTRYKCWPTGHGAMLDNGKTGKDDASAEGVTYKVIEGNF